MKCGWLQALAGATVLSVSMSSAATAQTPMPSIRDTALILYGYTLFPVFVALHCDNVVDRDNPAMEQAVKRWHVRESAYFDRIVTVIDGTGGLSKQTADTGKQVARSAAEREVEKQTDKAAYCREFPGRLDAGEFDLDQAANMSPLLRHLMSDAPR
jgi:hypothetical protein